MGRSPEDEVKNELDFNYAPVAIKIRLDAFHNIHKCNNRSGGYVLINCAVAQDTTIKNITRSDRKKKKLLLHKKW